MVILAEVVVCRGVLCSAKFHKQFTPPINQQLAREVKEETSRWFPNRMEKEAGINIPGAAPALAGYRISNALNIGHVSQICGQGDDIKTAALGGATQAIQGRPRGIDSYHLPSGAREIQGIPTVATPEINHGCGPTHVIENKLSKPARALDRTRILGGS
jgi:hypothetical protein